MTASPPVITASAVEASALASSGDKTPPLTTQQRQPPRANDKTGANSMLAAAIGLTSLGTSNSPTKASPSPSTGGGEKDVASAAQPSSTESVRALNVSQNTYKANQYGDKSSSAMSGGNEIIKPSPVALNPMPSMPPTSMPPRPEAMTMMSPPSTMRPPPAQHYHHTYPPAYPTLPPARPPTLEQPSPYWSSAFRPPPAPPFDGLPRPPHPHLNPHAPGPPLSDAALGMDPFSVGERLAAMDRAAAHAAAFATRPSPYDHPYYPPYASRPPMMPAPHQANLPIPNNKNFPETLFAVISEQENAHIISWLPHGQGFVIHDKQRFASMILPRYFDGAKFTSFTRRLKRWNFVRVPRGPELGAYYNKDFVRGHLELVQTMRYRVDGQFDKAKEKSDGKQDEDEDSDEHGESEGESKVEDVVSLSNNEARVNDSSPRQTSQEDSKLHQSQVHPARIQSPEYRGAHYNNPQDCHMPLSGTLSNRSMAVPATNRSLVPSDALGNRPPVNADPSQYPHPPGNPRLVWPNAPNDQRYGMGMMPHDVIPGGARLLPPSSATRPIMGSNLPGQPYYPTPRPAQRMINVERTPHNIYEAPPTSAQDYRHNINNNYANQEMAGSRIRGSPNIQPEIPGAPMGDVHGRGRSDSGGRAVMMSQQEEEEFARYLIQKRRTHSMGASMA